MIDSIALKAGTLDGFPEQANPALVYELRKHHINMRLCTELIVDVTSFKSETWNIAQYIETLQN